MQQDNLDQPGLPAGDHRALARRLDLYHMEESAPGMIYWHPPGWRIYRLLENFIRRHMERLDYQEVRSPQLLPRSLWEASGHWEKFGENMFSLPRPEGRDMALKPMSCPGHLQIFNDGLKSWRDLPVRLCEFGQCHRDEPSGSLHGLMRSRAFEQDDAHVICAPEQVEQEVARFVGLLREVYDALGFPEVDVSLSLRPEKRAGEDAQWDLAEDHLLEAARSCGLEPRLQPGEGAFYGPKLEFAFKDLKGRAWQCGTIQLDMVLPGRLGAAYIGQDGAKHEPVVLHHAVLGSLGRFIGILLENNEGHLPFWLAPCQVAILPIAEAHQAFADCISEKLRNAGLRPRIFDQSESLSRRIVAARESLIPARIVIGRREVEAGRAMLWIDGNERSIAVEELVSYLGDRASPP